MAQKLSASLEAQHAHAVSAESNHLSHTFNWKMASERALQKQLYRAIHLERCNPDYQIQYPAEHRDNPDGAILPHCHKEAEKRILEKHEQILKRAITPTVDRPKRLSRVG